MGAILSTMNRSLSIVSFFGLALFVSFFITVSYQADASVTPGLYATLATTSLADVGPNLFSSTTPRAIVTRPTTNCASRVITTVGQPIMLGFGAAYNGTTTPSGTSGVLQAASTTIVYDGGQFGCGQITAYGFGATTSITFSEFR